MHPMSLFERGESSGVVSLSDICAGGDIGVQTVKSPSLEELVSFVVCGGWPGSLGKTPRQAAAIPREYIENVIKIDVPKLDGIERDQTKVRKCLRSLARNESTTAALATIRDDIEESDAVSLSVNTVGGYLDAFRRIYLTNDIEPFSTFLRSPARIKQASKRHFCDPSIAAALLGASEKMLLRDLRTFGLLFESLAIRDLQIYAESLGARLFHYQDYDGREIDAVVQFDDGAWSAFEIKLNPADVDDAAVGLKKVASLFRHNPPSSLSVVVGKYGIAHRREDGVYVLPITSLRP
jgi:predicted AAA+ superfamily ATPase